MGGLFGLRVRSFTASSTQADVVIKETVQGFGAFGQLGEVAFQRFGARVEQA